MIYLDYSATTPISEQALHILNEVSKQYFGNPSSMHDIGSKANHLLSTCRNELASCFNGEGRGIYFTGGGSDSNHLAISSLARGNQHKGKHIITSRVEHASVLNTCQSLEEEGFKVTYLPVNEYGQISIETLKAACQSDTILVSITHASSEIGTIQPIEGISQFLNTKGIIFHSDCVQTFGKIPIDVKKAKLDSISISSHKVYGPKGVGACYINPELKWKSVIPNTTHEKGFRHGTVNLPGIAGFVTAAKETLQTMDMEMERTRQMTTKLLNGIKEKGWNVVLEGHPITRLPHHLGLRLVGMEGQYAMLELNRKGIAISTGTACLAGENKPSETMQAIGKTFLEANEFIRITVGKLTTDEDIDTVIIAIDNMLSQYFAARSY